MSASATTTASIEDVRKSCRTLCMRTAAKGYAVGAMGAPRSEFQAAIDGSVGMSLKSLDRDAKLSVTQYARLRDELIALYTEIARRGREFGASWEAFDPDAVGREALSKRAASIVAIVNA